MSTTTSFRRTRHRTTAAPVIGFRSRWLRFRHAALVGLIATIVAVPALLATASGRASASLPSGDGVVLHAPIVGIAATPHGQGYWLSGADGGVFAFGDAGFYGSTGTLQLHKPIVGIAGTPDGKGYWLVASDGGVFAFGDADFFGSTGSIQLTMPIVGIDSTPDGRGYWLVASDGGVFAFGDAGFFGSTAGMAHSSSIVGLAITPDGQGYWEAGADGSVFAFGDARYSGRATSSSPFVGITASGGGYRLASADGGVFDFGNARFYGSTSQPLGQPTVGMVSTTRGYLTTDYNGGIFAFGDVGFYGSLGGSTVAPPPGPPAAASDSTGITEYQRAAWYRVNVCEEGGVWNVEGSVYAGGLGMSRANWSIFNTFGYPSDAARATPDQQIRVAVAFATRYLGGPDAAPDQHGCSGGY